MSTHYVATLVVKRVEHTDPGPTRTGTTPSERRVADLATLTVKSPTIEQLVTKVQAHLALVEDVPGADVEVNLKPTGLHR